MSKDIKMNRQTCRKNGIKKPKKRQYQTGT